MPEARSFFKISTEVIAEVNRVLGRNLTFITRWSMQQTCQEVVPMSVYVVYVHLLSLLYKVASKRPIFKPAQRELRQICFEGCL